LTKGQKKNNNKKIFRKFGKKIFGQKTFHLESLICEGNFYEELFDRRED